jgi:hypothetical protein
MNDPRLEKNQEPNLGQCYATFYDRDENEFQIPVSYSYYDRGRDYFVNEYDTTQEAWDFLCAAGQSEYYDETVKLAIVNDLNTAWCNVEFPYVRHKATIVEQNPN